MRALEDGFCCFHSPRMAERRKAAHAAGGRHSATKERMARKLATTSGPLAQVQDILLHSIAGVLQDRIDPRKGGAVAALSNALVRCYEAAVLKQEQAELEQRLAALEGLATQNGHQHGRRTF